MDYLLNQEHIQEKFAYWKQQDTWRELSSPKGIDFSSNDYLSFSSHPHIQKKLIEALEDGIPLGSGASRLLRGNTLEHERAEEEAEKFFHSEAALFFSSGFLANHALFSTLPSRKGMVIGDRNIHASIKEGARASHASWVTVPHNDVQAFEDVIKKARNDGVKDIWLAVESLYSMDGDFAPLKDLYNLAKKENTMLVIDEAHATGIYGPTGRGLWEKLPRDENIITVHTCGKALGIGGCFIASSAMVRNYLVNAARSFIYTTAPSPLLTRAVREVLLLVDKEPWRREELLEKIDFAKSIFSQATPASPIIPIMLYDNQRAIQVAKFLQKEHFDVRAIRAPTVPTGTARLRITIHWKQTCLEIKQLGEALERAMEYHGVQ